MLVYADWFWEQGRDAEALAWSLGPLPYIDFGRGSGSGSGIGFGSGFGIGSGSGSGFGFGSKNFDLIFSRWEMEVGKSYMIFCGDWHVFVGRCVRQSGPVIFQFETVSKIQDTNNGDNWEKLAAGDKESRLAADYRHYTTPMFLPLSIGAAEWVGELPQEFSK